MRQLEAMAAEPALGETAAQAVARRADAAFDKTLFEIASTPVTVGTLVTIGLVLLATLVLARFLESVLTRVLTVRGKAGEGEIRALRRLTRYALWMTGFTIALSTAGVNLNALFAAGAVFAVAVGFAMQNIVENFVSGVILLLERTIKPGDVLELDGQMVRVARMGLRTTVARTLDDEDLVVPNSRLVQTSVKNYTLRDPQYRVRARVGVAYTSDMKQVEDCLTTAAVELPWRLNDLSPRVLLLEFGASSVDWEVSVWIDDPWRTRTRRSDLQLAIWNALRDANIAIAYPQLDVHFDREWLAPLVRRLGGDLP